MERDHSSGPSARAQRSQPDQVILAMGSEGRGKLLDTLDVVAKILAAVAAASATYVASTWQTRMSATTLLSQREQAESQLRASMFSNLIGPVAGPQKDQPIRREREQLLVELLALNFHEHFEVKPLLLRVDEEIADERDKGGDPKEAQKARHSIRSVARRVAARQLALLLKEGTNGNADAARVRIDDLTITESPRSPEQQRQFKGLVDNIEVPSATGGAAVVNVRRQAVRDVGNPETFPTTSPDGRYDLYITATAADWENETFDVEASFVGSDQASTNGATSFTLTWYDFPFIDNTLLADGNRFAIVLSAVNAEPETTLKQATLQVIWFPRNFFTPRERPLDYDKFLELVGKRDSG